MVIKNNFPIVPVNKNNGQVIESKGKKLDNDTKSFENILNEQIKGSESLKFSKHAKQRIETRDIQITQDQSQRIENGVKDASDKGVKDSLVLCDNLAFVVSVKNNTVVTALNDEDLKSNVFTNIDGAVIV